MEALRDQQTAHRGDIQTQVALTNLFLLFLERCQWAGRSKAKSRGKVDAEGQAFPIGCRDSGIPGLKVTGTMIEPKWLNIGNNLFHQVINILATSSILLLVVQTDGLPVFSLTREVPLERLGRGRLEPTDRPGCWGQVSPPPGAMEKMDRAWSFFSFKPKAQSACYICELEVHCTACQVSSPRGGVVTRPQNLQNRCEWLRQWRPLS